MVHGSYHDLVEEKDLLKEQELFHQLNKQRHKHNVIQAVRRQQLPAIMEQSGLDFRDFSHHEHEQQLQHWSHEDFQFRQLEALESTAEHVKNLLTDTRLKYVRRGQVFGNRFLLPNNTFCQLDLIHPESVDSPPPISGGGIDTPRRPVPRVEIYNEGPTPGVLYVATNQDISSTRTSVQIPASLYPYAFIIDTGEPVIERLNFKAINGAITVNVISYI